MGQGRIHEGQILHRDTQTDKEAFQGLFTFLAHVRSVLVFPEGDTGIMAAKAEIIGKDNVHICLAGNIGDVVKIHFIFCIRIFVIDGRRNDAGFNSEDGSNGFHAAGSPNR